MCSDLQMINEYNDRVKDALTSLKEVQTDVFIKIKGRTADENAFVFIQENNYSGYGFVPKETPIHQPQDLVTFIVRQKNTLETQRIIESYLRKNPDSVFSL